MRSIGIALCAAALVVSCGSDQSDSTTTATDDTKFTFTTGDFDVPAGDSFECFYTNTITSRELGVNRSNGIQGAGGHHITVYYTDLKRPAEHHPCKDDEMTTWHMIAGTGGETGALTESELNLLPPGFAVKVPPGKQLVVQTHYINTSGKTQKRNDTVTLELLQPSQVKQYANFVASSHESWTIPAKAPLETTSTCTLNNDVQLVTMLGHMHELGKRYKAEMIDPAGKTTPLLDVVWQASYASHPPITKFTPEKPLVLKKGTKIRQTCKWDNETAESVIFPREMCVFFGIYYPDQGELFCDGDT